MLQLKVQMQHRTQHITTGHDVTRVDFAVLTAQPSSITTLESIKENIQALIYSSKNLPQISVKASSGESLEIFAMADTQDKNASAREKVVSFVLNLLSYVVAWVNRAFNVNVGIKPPLNPSLDKLVYPSRQADDKAAFVADVEGFVTKTPNSVKNFFKGKPDYIKDVAQRTADLADDPTTPICQKDLLPKTISVSLHQQVLYCDDSGSRKRDGRWDAQRNLANRIARITTRILPPSEGVALRFINQNIGDIIGSTKWGGDTPIGTSLRSKILQPLVYDKIQSNVKLDRPLLVSIITDGMPEPEPRNTLVNTIVDCGYRLMNAGHERASVKFVIGRVGTAKMAATFLSEVQADQRIADLIVDQMDKKMEDVNDSVELDRWLIETLFSPIKDAGDKKTN
ncbi:hypothetical protein SUNI508_11633 [Seiridium unicorne]|uniref:VWFA domain-containing protein n=1 Tax=Seiridium unicorne TaxID=138068 RepID=A0ABR2UGR2_9PEZI